VVWLIELSGANQKSEMRQGTSLVAATVEGEVAVPGPQIV
jgi:hypothetical protein